jgi:dynein assembly factor with WDR repeat domains 1
VQFNPQGTRVLTASSDGKCKIWDAAQGTCAQTLEGHTDEIFGAAFNYAGDKIITGSKDNTCRVWTA